MFAKGSLIAQARRNFKPVGFPTWGNQQAQLWFGGVWEKPHPLRAEDRTQHSASLSLDFPNTGWREKKRSRFVLHSN